MAARRKKANQREEGKVIKTCTNCKYWREFKRGWGVCDWLFFNKAQIPAWARLRSLESGIIEPITNCNTWEGKR